MSGYTHGKRSDGEGDGVAHQHSESGLPPDDGAVWVRIAKDGEDIEIEAIKRCGTILGALTEHQCMRALAYLTSKFTQKQ